MGESDPFAAILRFKEVEWGQNNLPARASALIGREAELKTLTTLLQNPEVRLVTLTGPGGSGKTRLGIEAAIGVAENFRRVFFVSLAPLTDPSLVIPKITATLGVAEKKQTDLIDNLKDYLKEKRVLLFLDNFEQVVSAATTVAELLSNCPMLKILATSRAPLRIRGEYEFPLPPLPTPGLKDLPSVEAVTSFPAVILFVERAQSVRSDFSIKPNNVRAIAEICARLDGLPLALELAAAYARIFSPEEMLRLLSQRGIDLLALGPRDLPPRQQTLRATIAWSYELLSLIDKKLFRHISVFADGFTLDDAEAVCKDNLGAQTLDGLSRLIEVNLVRREEIDGESRYVILNTIRDFAFELLMKHGESTALQLNYRDHYLLLAEMAGPELRGPKQSMWLQRLDRECDNLRAALRCSIEMEDKESSLRFVSALWNYWFIRGFLTEGQQWLTSVLDLTRSEQSPARAEALLGSGVLALWQFNFSVAHSLLQECTALSRRLGEEKTLAFALGHLATVTEGQGDFANANALLESSLELFRKLEDNWGIAFALNELGRVSREFGNYDKARAFLEQSLALYTKLGDKRYMARSMANLGAILEREGEYHGAQKLYEESLSLSRQLGERMMVSALLVAVGIVKARLGLMDEARVAMAESLYLSKEIGETEAIVDCLEELASWACKKGESDRAAKLLGAAQTVRESIHLPVPPAYRADVQRDLASAKSALGDRVFNEEILRGKAMSLDEVIAFALEQRPTSS